MPYLINHQALKGLKRTIADAVAAKKGIHCPNCGSTVNKGDVFCCNCGTQVGIDPNVPMEIYKVPSMTAATKIAAERNSNGKWSYWDEPEVFGEDKSSLMRFAEKEDKRLVGTGIFVEYIVSEKGSVGHILEDEDNGELFVEWIYFAEGEIPEQLPQNSDDPRIPR